MKKIYDIRQIDLMNVDLFDIDKTTHILGIDMHEKAMFDLNDVIIGDLRDNYDADEIIFVQIYKNTEQGNELPDDQFNKHEYDVLNDAMKEFRVCLEAINENDVYESIMNKLDSQIKKLFYQE